MYALYFGGMAQGTNFHANVAIRMGYEAEVARIQELYLSAARTRQLPRFRPGWSRSSR